MRVGIFRLVFRSLFDGLSASLQTAKVSRQSRSETEIIWNQIGLLGIQKPIYWAELCERPPFQRSSVQRSWYGMLFIIWQICSAGENVQYNWAAYQIKMKTYIGVNKACTLSTLRIDYASCILLHMKLVLTVIGGRASIQQRYSIPFSQTHKHLNVYVCISL